MRKTYAYSQPSLSVPPGFLVIRQLDSQDHSVPGNCNSSAGRDGILSFEAQGMIGSGTHFPDDKVSISYISTIRDSAISVLNRSPHC
jgi:hypothetical protein